LSENRNFVILSQRNKIINRQIMTIDEAIISRHSVRKYTDQKIDDATKEALQQTIDECNREGNLKIKLSTDDPTPFIG